MSAWRAMRRLSASNAATRSRARSSAAATSVKGSPWPGMTMRIVERGDHLDRRARRGQGGGVELRRHHESEAVLPQRVAGNEDAVLGVVEHERAHVVPGRRERTPLEIAPDVRRSGLQSLASRRSARRAGRSSRRAAPSGPSARRAPPRPRAPRSGIRTFATIAALPPMWSEWQCVLTIHASGSLPMPRGDASSASVSGACRRYPVSISDVAVAALQHDVVRRQPVADENVKLRRQQCADMGNAGILPSSPHKTGRGAGPSRLRHANAVR